MFVYFVCIASARHADKLTLREQCNTAGVIVTNEEHANTDIILPIKEVRSEEVGRSEWKGNRTFGTCSCPFLIAAVIRRPVRRPWHCTWLRPAQTHIRTHTHIHKTRTDGQRTDRHTNYKLETSMIHNRTYAQDTK